MDNLPSQLEQQAAKLEEELRDCLAAEKLLDYQSGQVLIKWLQARCNVYIKQLTSDKFLKDHTGFVQAQAKLKENQFLLNKINAAAHPRVQQKIREKLEETKESLELENTLNG